MTIGYDHEGKNSLAARSDTLVSNVTYNQRGQMVSLVRSSFTSSYSYYNGSGNSGPGNNNFRLSSIQHGALYDSLPNFSYSYDKAGNILGQTIQLTSGVSDSQSYTYDALNRLKTASGSGSISGVASYNHTYSYDKLGNLTSLGSGSYDYSSWHTNCGTPPSQPFPHAVRKVGSSDYFCYDNNGNMITRKLGSTTYSQSYDVENRLTEVTANTNSTVTQFSYDSQGQRTSSDVETPGVSKTVTHYPFPTYQEETRYLWQYHCEGGRMKEAGVITNGWNKP
ncbi:MAG: hypothetical protein KJ063_03590 [Anaerolineae bacterium]|nr:hypothetical protein [Anaerolineae bacterium]